MAVREREGGRERRKGRERGREGGREAGGDVGSRADGTQQWWTLEFHEPPHKDNNKFRLNQHLAEVITVAQTVIQFQGGVYDIY